MKIINWNVERVKDKYKYEIKDILEKIDADIIVLTETSSALSLNNYYCIQTTSLPNQHEGINYKVGENRVAIWSKTPLNMAGQTYDHFTSIFAKTTINKQLFYIYGNIIGTQSIKKPFFDNQLKGQLTDMTNLFDNKTVICLGDFNTTLKDKPWPSRFTQESLLKALESHSLEILTLDLPVCIDHITVSRNYLINKKIILQTWNEDKKLSDHYGICATIE